MLLTIAVILWVIAATWFLVTWVLFGVQDRRHAALGDATYELHLDRA